MLAAYTALHATRPPRCGKSSLAGTAPYTVRGLRYKDKAKNVRALSRRREDNRNRQTLPGYYSVPCGKYTQIFRQK